MNWKTHQRETHKIELVETHAIALSLLRLRTKCMDADAWKRALCHALDMEYCGSRDQRAVVRATLNGPNLNQH